VIPAAPSVSLPAPTPRAPRLSFVGGLFLVWLVGVAWLVALLALRLRWLWRTSARASRDLPARLESQVRATADAMGLRRPPRVRLSDEITGPCVAGLLRPVVLLPPVALDALDDEELATVLAHEFAHVRRRDALANWMQVVVETANFHNPLVWIAGRWARLERELACDATALAHGRRESCADAVLKVIRLAQAQRRMPRGLPALSEGRHLRRRFAQILDAERPLRPRMSWPMLGVLALIALVLWPLAAPADESSPSPTALQPVGPDIAAFLAERQLTEEALGQRGQMALAFHLNPVNLESPNPEVVQDLARQIEKTVEVLLYAEEGIEAARRAGRFTHLDEESLDLFVVDSAVNLARIARYIASIPILGPQRVNGALREALEEMAAEADARMEEILRRIDAESGTGDAEFAQLLRECAVAYGAALDIAGPDGGAEIDQYQRALVEVHRLASTVGVTLDEFASRTETALYEIDPPEMAPTVLSLARAVVESEHLSAWSGVDRRFFTVDETLFVRAAPSEHEIVRELMHTYESGRVLAGRGYDVAQLSLVSKQVGLSEEMQRDLAKQIVETVEVLLYTSPGNDAGALQGRRHWLDEFTLQLTICDTPANIARITRHIQAVPQFAAQEIAAQGVGDDGSSLSARVFTLSEDAIRSLEILDEAGSLMRHLETPEGDSRAHWEIDPEAGTFSFTGTEGQLEKLEALIAVIPGAEAPRTVTRAYAIEPGQGPQIATLVGATLDAQGPSEFTRQGRRVFAQDDALIVRSTAEEQESVAELLGVPGAHAGDDPPLRLATFSLVPSRARPELSSEEARNLTAQIVETVEVLLYARDGREAAEREGRRLWFDDFIHQLTIADTPENVDRVTRHIRAIPQLEHPRITKIVVVGHVLASAAAERLDEVNGRQIRIRGVDPVSDDRDAPIVQADDATNTLLVSVSNADDLDAIEKAIAVLDVPGASGEGVAVFEFMNAPGGTVQNGAETPSEAQSPEPTIDLDTRIIIAPPADGSPLPTFIENLVFFDVDLDLDNRSQVNVMVTDTFLDEPLREVLDTVFHPHGLVWRVEGSTLIVELDESLKDAPLQPPIAGTWRFDNPEGDDEQMSVFIDGRVLIFYSNGHIDESRLQRGEVHVPEYGENRTMRLTQTGRDTILGTPGPEPAQGLAKIWRRIRTEPLDHCLIFDEQGNELSDDGLHDRSAAREWINASATTVTPPPTPQPHPGPPRIVATNPPQGARDVDPNLTEITVTFDRDMATTGWSWTGGGDLYPETTGAPHYRTARTAVLPVKLEAGRLYRVGINSSSHRNFRSVDGMPTPPRAIWFCTEGAGDEDLAFLEPPKPIEIVPAPGTMDVDPDLAEIRITFDQPMGGGRSVTGGGDTFPPMAEGGTFAWSDDRKTLSFPVALEPDHEYYFGINSFSHVNFQSDHGVPAPWTRVPFHTAPRD
jgi:beta-lactamase regulating signal transducer with metallopeptidase domain